MPTDHRNDADAPTLAQAVIVELAMGAVGLVLIVLSGRSLADAFAMPVPAVPALALGLVLGVVLGGAFGLGVTRSGVAERVRPFLARFTSAPLTLAVFVTLGVAAALGEETLFRAAIQPLAGIIVAWLLFMAAHALIADFRHPTPGKVAYAALAVAMGLVLGLLYERAGIAASMACHAAFDATALFVARPLLAAARNEVLAPA